MADAARLSQPECQWYPTWQGKTYYRTSWYMYTALKKALEYGGPLLHNFVVDLWLEWLAGEACGEAAAGGTQNRLNLSQIAFSPKFCYRWESTGYSIINELCRHSYGHRNLGHGRFRPEVLRHRYFYVYDGCNKMCTQTEFSDVL
jgi:hypothetical protein